MYIRVVYGFQSKGVGVAAYTWQLCFCHMTADAHGLFLAVAALIFVLVRT